MGAITAFLGMHKVMPLVHGAQGCVTFTKNFLTQHFREVTPMQSTAVFDIATIIGDDSNLTEGIANVIDKQKPDFIGLVTTGMTEVRGDDIKGSMIRFRDKYPQYNSTPVITVSCPISKGMPRRDIRRLLRRHWHSLSLPRGQTGLQNPQTGKYSCRDAPHRRRYRLAETHIRGVRSGRHSLSRPFLSMGGQVNHFYGLPEGDFH